MRAPGAGGVARRAHVLQVAVGQHAEHRRVLDVDVAAECAGETDAVDVVDAEPIHEQRDAGIQRRLRELNRAHVVLRDLHLDRVRTGDASMQNVGERPAVLDDARGARGQSPVEHAVLIDDPGEIHLRDHLDDAGPAHAGDAE